MLLHFILLEYLIDSEIKYKQLVNISKIESF